MYTVKFCPSWYAVIGPDGFAVGVFKDLEDALNYMAELNELATL
jgi:hypothetical protein